MRLQHAISRFDWILLLSALALTSVGLVVMYGIGIARPEIGIFLFEKQAVASAIGLGMVALAAFFLDYRQLRGLSLPVYGIGALLLIGVLIFGRMVNGTRGWYAVGGLMFQPVEVAKVCLIVSLAAYLVRFAHGKLTWSAILRSALFTAGYVGLVFLQPDFGSAAVMLIIWAAMIAFTGLSWRSYAVVIGVAGLAAFVAWTFVFQSFQKDRFLAFFDPTLDPRGAGYNVTQARIAIGSGGIFGKGIGEGSQSRLRFLPEAATDFTFAVVGEELGFVGIAFVLACFAVLFSRFYVSARNAEDDFAALLAVGLMAALLIHTLVNAGMNLGIMPVTGIPLPFLSGASSYVFATYIALGIFESIAVYRRANQ